LSTQTNGNHRPQPALELPGTAAQALLGLVMKALEFLHGTPLMPTRLQPHQGQISAPRYRVRAPPAEAFRKDCVTNDRGGGLRVRVRRAFCAATIQSN
jgi:hypothetical protein